MVVASGLKRRDAACASNAFQMRELFADGRGRYDAVRRSETSLA